MARAHIILLDSFGIGGAPDAAKYGDTGANTFGHIVEACERGEADQEGVRQGPLNIPNLLSLGLGLAFEVSTGKALSLAAKNIKGKYGAASELSPGKDTPSGHWEICGVPVLEEWGYFPKEYPSFPEKLLSELIKECSLPGILGNCHSSGTEIIKKLGEEHQLTGRPIVYTSADSVFQIAAHEEGFGLDKLYAICEVARKLVDAYNIGRVIARPFKGSPGSYYRTGNRRDYAVPPPGPTLLDRLIAEGGEVIAIGKVADIFAHRGISKKVKADGNIALFDAFQKEVSLAPTKSLVFVNLVDFDMVYGHRRDIVGYAHALETLDAQLSSYLKMMKSGDVCVITADHGCDPTWPGSDHTRENIPVLYFGPGIPAENIGLRKTFADIGQTLAKHLGISPLPVGEAF